MHRTDTDITIAAQLMQGDGVDRREEIYALQAEYEAAEKRLYVIARAWVTAGKPSEDTAA